MQQYCCAGLNFGSYADRSPIIAYDGEAHPAYTMASFTPSTVPGCRTPHLWLDDGRSLYDAMGPDYTLLRFDPTVDAGRLLAAARQRGMPRVLVDVSAKDAAAVYRHKLVLSRPISTSHGEATTFRPTRSCWLNSCEVTWFSQQRNSRTAPTPRYGRKAGLARQIEL